MQKTTFEQRCKALRFRHFSGKGYSLFSCIGKEVLIGTLSVATLTNAKAEGVSIKTELADGELQRVEHRLDDVVITGSRTPLTQAEAAKIVTVISREDIDRAAVTSINDILKLATGVDVRQRGGFGVQTDISVRGGNFDQITILLNGVNISSPQTGHLSADFPLSPDDILRVEVLQGPAARVYGTSAFNGVVNIVTRGAQTTNTQHPSPTNFYATLSGGSYGYANANGGVLFSKSLPSGRLEGAPRAVIKGALSGGYSRSDGATPNSDFTSSRVFYNGSYATDNLRVDAQIGYSYKPYGANTFYGASSTDQWESNERWMVALKADAKVGKLHLMPQAYWNRWNDHYQWHRGVSPAGENYHQTDVYGLGMNSWFETSLGKTSIGLEMRNEGIWSTNLGNAIEEDRYRNVGGHDGNDLRQYVKRDQRTNVSAFLEHNILLNDWTFSLGLLANHNTGLDAKWRFYPGVDIAYRPSDHWKILASWSMALRMPTFTDLYYNTQGANIEGNKNLKPEKTSDLQLGTRYTGRGFIGELQAFYSHKTDMIDWVTTPDYYKEKTPGVKTYIFHSVNFKSDNVGIDLNLQFLPQEIWGSRCPLRKVAVQYSWLNESSKYDVEVMQSKYAMEYLRNKLVISADGRIVSKLNLGLSWRLHDRVGGNNPSYALVDGRLSWDAKHYSLFAEATNLFNRHYYDYISIPQPGFQFQAGVKVRF